MSGFVEAWLICDISRSEYMYEEACCGYYSIEDVRAEYSEV